MIWTCCMKRYRNSGLTRRSQYCVLRLSFSHPDSCLELYHPVQPENHNHYTVSSYHYALKTLRTTRHNSDFQHTSGESRCLQQVLACCVPVSSQCRHEVTATSTLGLLLGPLSNIGVGECLVLGPEHMMNAKKTHL